MKKFKVFLLTILCTVMFWGCEKSYDTDDVGDIKKIKELLVDADCDIGISVKYECYHPLGTSYSNDIYYCDNWDVNTGNVDEFYKGLGNVSSVIYKRNKKSVIIENYKTTHYPGGEFYYHYTYSFYHSCPNFEK